MPVSVKFNPQRQNWIVREKRGRKYVSSRSLPSEAAANEYAAQLEAAREAQRPSGKLHIGGPVFGRDLLRDWALAAQSGWGAHTAYTNEASIRLHLAPAFQDVDLRHLTKEQIQAFGRALAAKGVGAHTVQNALSLLRRALNWALEMQFLERAPMRNICGIGTKSAKQAGAAEGQRTAFTREEMGHMLKLASERGEQSALYAVVYVALCTGARLSELLEIRWADITFSDSPSIQFARRRTRFGGIIGNTKNGKVRSTEMSEDLATYLRQLHRVRMIAGGSAEDCVLLGHAGKQPWTRSALVKAWRRLRTRAGRQHGVRPLPLHCLRHTYVSWAIEANEPHSWVAEQIGDRIETMYRHYAHFFKSGVRRKQSWLSVSVPVAVRPDRKG